MKQRRIVLLRLPAAACAPLLLAGLMAAAPACKGDAGPPTVTIAKGKQAAATAPADGAAAAGEGAADDRPLGPDELGPGTVEQQQILLEAKKAFLTDRYDEAERHFLVLAKSQPTSGPTVSAAIALGQIYLETDRNAEALALYQDLARRVENVPEVLLVVARAYASMGEDEPALSAYRRTLELQPDFIFALPEMGTILAQTGRNEEAGEAFYRYEQKIYDFARRLEDPETPDAERLQILEAFALVSDDRALEATVKALKDRHPHIRMAAAVNLGELGAVAARAELERVAIEDPETQVRMAARSALQALANAPAEAAAEPLGPARVDDPSQLP